MSESSSVVSRLGLFDKSIDRATFARAIAVCAGFLAGLAAGQLDGSAPSESGGDFRFWYGLAAIICLIVVYHILAHISDSREEIASFSVYAGVATLTGAAVSYLLDVTKKYFRDNYSDFILFMILFLIFLVIIHSMRANLNFKNVSLRRTATMTIAVSAAELSAFIGVMMESGFARAIAALVSQSLLR